MSHLFLYFKKRPHLLILGFILLIGLFFRSYQVVERFEFAHDGDLYSWIVKDIVVNHHPRLIGQLTSAPGVFIGGLFYYLLIPFFLLFNMDPIGVTLLGILVGVVTILSYYFVLNKLFNRTVGLIAAFLHAVLLSNIGFDRWIVPSLPTKLWAIWYFYCLIMISRRNFSVLPILAILIGLIWHIHIALAPALLAIPIILIINKKLPRKRELMIFLVVLTISLLPLILFETRHSFSQTKSLISNFTSNFGSEKNIFEKRNILLDKQTDYSLQNFNPASNFIIEATPTENSDTNQMLNLKITTKNPKYSTMIIYLDCGNPKKFEIGSITGEFLWSNKDCLGNSHQITATARISGDSILKTLISKFLIVLSKENTNIQNMIFSPLSIPLPLQYLFTFVILLSPFIAWRTKSLNCIQVISLYSWILGVFLFFTFSSIIISEYYLAFLEIVFLSSLSLIFLKVYQNKKIGQYLILILLLVLFIKNFSYFMTQENYKKGYIERKSVAGFIATDSKEKNYPCVAINYISPRGEDVGFRYFLYLNKMHLVHPSNNIPTYNIVIPDELSNEVKQKFGHIGIIPPTNIPSKEIIDKSCQIPDTNLTDPMFGFVN